MNMNHDLIDQLKQLTPTDGEWEFNTQYSLINSFKEGGDVIPIATIYSRDDLHLIALAPQMRTTILEMAKEIEELKNDVRRSLAHYIQSEGCSCCRDTDSHNEALEKLAELLDMDKYSDGSGIDYSKYLTPAQK